MNIEQQIIEIREAKAAGNRALTSLSNAQGILNSAGNWGIVDMFGGGFFTSLIKHSKINDANRQIEQAIYELQKFKKELRDVNIPAGFGVNVGEFLTFADFFFDGLIADWMVQSKIGEAKRQVEEAIGNVRKILMSLDEWERNLGGMQ